MSIDHPGQLDKSVIISWSSNYKHSGKCEKASSALDNGTNTAQRQGSHLNVGGTDNVNNIQGFMV